MKSRRVRWVKEESSEPKGTTRVFPGYSYKKDDQHSITKAIFKFIFKVSFTQSTYPPGNWHIPWKGKFWSWCSELPVWWDMHPFPRGESFVCCINSFFWGQPSRGMDWLLECSRHLARRAQAHAQPRPCSRWCCCGEWWGNDPSNHVRSEWNTELCWVYSVGAEFANIILLEDNERSSYLLL